MKQSVEINHGIKRVFLENSDSDLFNYFDHFIFPTLKLKVGPRHRGVMVSETSFVDQYCISREFKSSLGSPYKTQHLIN